MENIAKISEKSLRTFSINSALTGPNNRYFLLSLLFGICTLFYYGGELAKGMGWVELEWGFFYVVHDVHRLLFLAPIVYAAFYGGTRLTLMISAASLMVFLPRAIFISPFPDPIARAIIFAAVEGAVGLLIAYSRNRHQSDNYTASVQNKDVLTGNELKTTKPERSAVKEMEFDLSRGLVKRWGRVVRLTRTEYKLLAFLVTNKGKMLSHQEILRNVWGAEYGNENEYLRTFIRQLRRKIEDDPAKPKLIITEQGTGYRFSEID
jgi:DNA-binding winged helix-turn-helix (wHTH) protein